jgi:tetratricopeptide (TPR) repeat protein
MKKLSAGVIILFCLLAQPLSALYTTPEQVIEAFYQARKFQNKTKMMVLAKHEEERHFTKEGEEGVKKKYIISYTINEIKVKNLIDAYALVEVKTKSIEYGLQVSDEYWKLKRVDGIWYIENIFFPSQEFIQKHLNPNWPLDVFVEKLIELEGSTYKVEVEEQVEEITGSPLEKAVFYFGRRRYREAFEQIDIHIYRSKNDSYSLALGYLIKGLMFYQLKNQDLGLKYLTLSININPQPYRDLVAYSQSGGGSGPQYDTTTTTRKRTINKSYDIDKMFSK